MPRTAMAAWAAMLVMASGAARANDAEGVVRVKSASSDTVAPPSHSDEGVIRVSSLGQWDALSSDGESEGWASTSRPAAGQPPEIHPGEHKPKSQPSAPKEFESAGPNAWAPADSANTSSPAPAQTAAKPKTAKRRRPKPPESLVITEQGKSKSNVKSDVASKSPLSEKPLSQPATAQAVPAVAAPQELAIVAPTQRIAGPPVARSGEAQGANLNTVKFAASPQDLEIKGPAVAKALPAGPLPDAAIARALPAEPAAATARALPPLTVAPGAPADAGVSAGGTLALLQSTTATLQLAPPPPGSSDGAVAKTLQAPEEAPISDTPSLPGQPRVNGDDSASEPTEQAPAATPDAGAAEAQLDSEGAMLVERMRRLNRPVNTIDLADSQAGADKDPANLAKLLQGDLPAVAVYGAPWHATHPRRYFYCFQHNPLYFEEANLERCGRAYPHCTVLSSSALFLGRTFMLPYSLVAEHPNDCKHTLGDCPTCHEFPHGAEHPGFSEKAAAVQAAAIVGAVFILL